MADVQCGKQSAIAPVLLNAIELLPGLAGPGWKMCGVGNNLPQLSTAELLPGLGGPRWQMCGVGSNLPQLQCC